MTRYMIFLTKDAQPFTLQVEFHWPYSLFPQGIRDQLNHRVTELGFELNSINGYIQVDGTKYIAHWDEEADNSPPLMLKRTLG